MGLNKIEVSILKHLQEAGDAGMSLTSLSAHTLMTRESIQRDCEIFLLRLGLITIETPKGRVLTTKGKSYLAELEKQKAII